MQIPVIDPATTALNYHNAEQVEAHGEEHPDHRMLGLLVFLGAEGMIFFGMFAAYLIYRAMAPVWPPEGTPTRELLLPAINTLILISSSFVIHNADTAIKKNDVAGMRNWLLLTAAMGAVFLFGQVYEYTHLEFGLTTNLYASCFYVLTAFHGLHVTLGVVLMMGVLWRAHRRSLF
jgi:cytochrome c oxidase subunit III